MDYKEILGFAGILLGIFALLAKGKTQRRVFYFLAITCLLVYSIIKPIYPFTILMIIAMGYYFYSIYKAKQSKVSINLLEVEYDNNYITEFIKNYKKDIYNFFPFYKPEKSHRCFLLMRDMNLAGIFIADIKDDVMTIEVDYTKPIYRDREIGNYIYKQNPGNFKKLGVSKLRAKSYHKGHSRFLLQMGFEQTYIDNQMYFVKNLD
ncbi:MAG TPA: hypothetical protein PKN32_06910 [Bacteroidales bacterium]|nr:hypothetical protein [Bacteroidales bacterium]